MKPSGICSILFPISLIFIEFHFRKRNSKNFIGFDCVIEIDVVKMFDLKAVVNKIGLPYSYFSPCIRQVPVQILFTPDIVHAYWIHPRPTYCRRGKVLWLVVVKRSIKQERYKSKGKHISYIYILATDWRRPHCRSALIDDCWPSKETFFEMLACNYDERTVKKWWLFQIWQWSGQHRLC